MFWEMTDLRTEQVVAVLRHVMMAVNSCRKAGKMRQNVKLDVGHQERIIFCDANFQRKHIKSILFRLRYSCRFTECLIDAKEANLLRGITTPSLPTTLSVVQKF
jgi:hypothetical protein